MRISDYIGWVKLQPKYLAAIALASTALLTLPTSVSENIGVQDFVDTYRMWIGVVCLASISLLLAHVSWIVKDMALLWLHKKRASRHAICALHQLTPAEKEILAEYIIRDTKSIKQDCTSGVILELQSSFILTQASPLGDFRRGFAFNMTPWAWKYLKEHPDILEPELSNHRNSKRRYP